MGNINYDSFYKFLVSLGIILVILPFTALIFLITNSFDLQISELELVTYTETAQNVVRMRQTIPLLIQEYATWLIMGLCALGGIILILYGLKKWYKLQKIEDICKEREAEKQMEAIAEKTIKMSDEQIIEKTVVEEGPSASVMKGFLIEQRFSNFIKNTKNSYTIKSNIIIGNCEYDVVAFSNKIFEKDYVYEIKYTKNKISFNQIEKYREKIKRLQTNFTDKLNRIPYLVLVIVVPDEMYEHTLDVVEKTEKWNNCSIEVMKESDLREK